MRGNDGDAASAAADCTAVRSVNVGSVCVCVCVSDGETPVFWKLNRMFQPASTSQRMCECVITHTHTHTCVSDL